MFRASVGNYDVAFTFRHDRDVNFEIKRNKVVTAVTSCFLTVNTENFEALAACAAEDNFCKEKGRKISLARALNEAQIPKDVRTAVWELYFKRSER